MSVKHTLYQVILLCLFILLSIGVFLIVERGIHFMLAWNALLAFIPIFMVFLFDRYKDVRILNVFIFLVWLFFYPNSLYLITDVIYINQDAFMQDQGMYLGLVYLRNAHAYIGYIHLLIGAFYGLFLSLVSFRYFYDFFKSKFKLGHTIFFIFIPLLVSIGIYMGRFLRFNTWDIFNPFNLLKDLLVSIDGFAWLYMALFSLIQYIVFTMYLLSKKDIFYQQ